MTRTVPQHWLLFAGPGDTGLAVQLEPKINKNGVITSFTTGPFGKSFYIELKTSENDNSSLNDAYVDLENSAKNGGSCGYALLQSEGYLRNEATFRFQFEKEYLKGDKLQNVSGASADLLFGLAVVTAVRSDLEYRPFAATGILSDGGQVQPIEGLQVKIRAALNTPALRGSGVIFYPKANDKDIDAELRYEVKRAQIALKPVESLEEAVEYLGITIQGHWIDNPYRRLDVFEYSHRRIFFGREDVTESLAIKLSDRATLERPSLLILGPSGAGKSSLVQAGLIPELEKKFKEENLSLLYSIFDLKSAANKDIYLIAASIRSSWGLLPGLAALAVSNTSKQQAAVTPSDVFEALVCDLLTYLPDQTRFVWVLDQLEHFFTLGLTKEADAAFIHLLRELQARGIWIVATFRNDFYSDLRAHDGISSIFDKDGVHDLEKPGETAIERIIQAPAELARLEFEKDDQKSELLSLRLKNDALKGGRDILPLLEFALDQLFEKRELKNGRTQLTWAAYKAMDGLQGAIGKRADEVLSKLDQAAQETLGRVLRALAKLRRDTIETEGEKSTFIASVANIEDFPADTPAGRLIDAFAHEKARLFSHDSDNKGNAQVRVTHEALFTHWSTAREILKDSMKDMVVRDRLADNEVDWRLKEKHASKLLPSGLPLEEAQDLLARRGDEKFLSPEIIHFIERSSSADQERKLKESEAQRRKTRLTTFTAVVLGILLVVAIGAVYYVNEARNEQAQMLASSYFSEGARLVDEGRPNEALAYLTQAMRIDPDPDTPAARLGASILLTSKQRINISTTQVLCHSRHAVGIPQFSPDGRWILVGCGHTVQVWDAITGESVSRVMQHVDTISSAQFSPDGRKVVTASRDKTARVWDATTGGSVSGVMQHADTISSAQFSPDGRKVVTASRDKTARVWDAATGLPVSEPMRHKSTVNSAQFSPDGRFVFTTSTDKAQLWEAATGKFLLKLSDHDHYRDILLTAQFSPDGLLVVTSSNKGVARVWQVATGMPVAEFKHHKDTVNSAQFSPDGRRVVTSSNDTTAQVWDAATGLQISGSMKHRSSVISAQFSPDGRKVVTASMDNTAQVWDATTGEPVSQPMMHNDFVNSAQFSPDGRKVVTGSWDGRARVWHATMGEQISQSMTNVKFVKSHQFGPDGRRVVTTSWDETARVWDAATGLPVSEPMQHKGIVNSVQFSPDGRKVVTASWDKTARVWDAATGLPVSEPMQHKDEVNFAQFSPDGRRVVTSSKDKTARVWDAATGLPVSELIQHKSLVLSAPFSPDGRKVVTASWDNTARVWDAATGLPVSEPMQHKGIVNSVQFSPDGRKVVTASWDNTARVWDAATGLPISEPMQHKGFVHSAQFSPDGRKVVTASNDRTARVWDATTGEPVSQLMVHNKNVNSAQFSSDGLWVITASEDKTTRIWESATGKSVSVLSLKYQSGIESAQIRANNQRASIIAGTIREWEIPRFPEISSGLRDFFDRISGYSVNSKNVLQTGYTTLTIKELRDWMAATDLTLEERAFIDWWLSDPIERTVTPQSKQTVKEQVQMMINHDTIASLNEALDYYPGHPMALAKLAAATWRETKTADQQDDIRPRVSLWANLALKYASEDTAVRTVAKKVLQDIAQLN